jgi:hypothetical protein
VITVKNATNAVGYITSNESTTTFNLTTVGTVTGTATDTRFNVVCLGS